MTKSKKASKGTGAAVVTVAAAVVAAPSTPTAAQFAAFQALYDYFNAALFGGTLRPVLLNFSRHANSYGFFAPDRWDDGAASVTHEISLNPSHLKERDARAVVSTLVHEMAHCWQQEYGKPSRRGYHNEQWAAKMDEIGLVPSSTAAVGGARTGYRVSHYIDEGGAFARAFAAMPEGLLLPWLCWEPTAAGGGKSKPRPVSKLKYTCPTCGVNAWGKPGLALMCGDCREDMTADAGAGAGAGAAVTTARESWAAA